MFPVLILTDRPGGSMISIRATPWSQPYCHPSYPVVPAVLPSELPRGPGRIAIRATPWSQLYCKQVTVLPKVQGHITSQSRGRQRRPRIVGGDCPIQPSMLAPTPRPQDEPRAALDLLIQGILVHSFPKHSLLRLAQDCETKQISLS